MLKYVDTMVVCSDVPDEITLAINISNCCIHCKGCHSPYLWEDIGIELTESILNKLIKENDGITCVCIMGGDAFPAEVNKALVLIEKQGLKSAWYSGKQGIAKEVDLGNLDYLKLGPYVEKLGGLINKTTNQVMYKITHDKNGITMKNITSKFWEKLNS